MRRMQRLGVGLAVVSLGWLASTTGLSASAARAPLPAMSLYAAPDAPATLAAQHVGADQARVLRRMGGTPTAQWLTDSRGPAQAAATMARAVRAGRVPVFVLYAVPHRDCGGPSGGGMTSAAAYVIWVHGVASALSGHRSIVVVEPDALAQLACLSALDRLQRLALLRTAVAELARVGSYAYLDAGHAAWVSAATMASRLQAAGIIAARGFALNVAFFGRTADEVTYGHALSQLVGGAPFVVDTSRNGLGPLAGVWCNPPGRALGTTPRVNPGDALVDALLWVKTPGASDGSCRAGQPAAGTFQVSVALDLAHRAGW